MKKALFVAAHPDDETLGCGGTILKFKKRRDHIYWLIVTSPKNKHRVKSRTKEIERVINIYEFDDAFKLDYLSRDLDTIPLDDIIYKMSQIINKLKPDIVFLPNRSDIHSDHKITFNSAYSCIKNFRFPFIKKILMYESLSETEFAPPFPDNAFNPNVFVDISEFFQRKIEVMRIYESEVMEEPYPRSLSSIEALARYRGSRIGVKYAEAFMLLFDKK